MRRAERRAAAGLRYRAIWLSGRLALALLLLLHATAGAQPLPSPALPSAPLPIQRPPELQPAPPPVEVAPITPGRVPTQAQGIRFVLQDVQIEGATAFSDAELRPLYADRLGREVAVADVFEIADAITRYYRDHGYVLSRAIVPPQQIAGGTARIRVVEGYVSDVVLEGELGRVRERAEGILLKVTQQRPVRLPDIERAMLLVNDLPGISATSVLRPAAELGAAQLVVNAVRKPFSGFVTTNNRGSDFIGPWTSALGGSENSFTTLGEQGSLLFFTAWPPKEQTYYEADVSAFLNDDGLRLRGTASTGPSEPSSTLRRFDIDQNATRAGLELSYPLWRTREWSLWLEGGYDYSLTTSNASGQKIFRDKIDAFRTGVRVEVNDSYGGTNLASFGLVQGAPLPGYTRDGADDKSRADASGIFTALRGEASRRQRITDSFELYTAYQGQYSPDPLLTDAQIKYGGTNFIRGYAPAELSGDSGAAISLELRYSQTPALRFVQFFQLYSFYEFASVWNHGDDLNKNDWLSSAGVGVRFVPQKWLFLELEFANGFQGQLSGNDEGEKPHQVYFTATASF